MPGVTSWCRSRGFQAGKRVNEQIEAQCTKNREQRLRRLTETIEQRCERDSEGIVASAAHSL